MKRVFHPGDEWLYIRLYSGPDTGEEWLARILPMLIRELKTKKIISSFFFIRYFDPQFHIRLRCRLERVDYLSKLVTLLRDFSAYYFSHDLIWKMELGSYDRELERYGEDWIEITERIFSFDSAFWLEILSQLRNDEDGEEKRWMASLYNVHLILDDFEFPLADRISLLSGMADGLFLEMGRGKKLKLDINQKFRTYRKQLESILLNQDKIKIEGFNHAADLRSQKMKGLSGAHNPMESDDKRRRDRFISDLIHMSLNRGFRSKHRLHELFVYSFLKRLYVSKDAGSK